MVYAASSHQVRYVSIRGRQVLRDGAPLALDPQAIIAVARAWGQRIAAE
jgi:5-methylthioadenosine/S-adenosylhomocysteine deaminase